MARPLKVMKNADDPTGILRASVGGTPAVGYYLVYRGDRAKVARMLREVLERFEVIEGDEHDD